MRLGDPVSDPRSALKPNAELKILEIGQFSLFKKNLPAQTTLVFTGEDMTQISELDCRIFSLELLSWLRRSLARGAWDIVVCHAPIRPVWDRKHGLRTAVAELWHRLRYFRTLGTYALRSRHPSPLILLDFNDEPNIPAHIFDLLDSAILCFKRELPADAAKAFLDSTREHRTHREVMSSPFVQRNLSKLRPISAAIPENTARLALKMAPSKHVDVFFAGAIHSTQRSAGLSILRAMQAQGYHIDCCENGLPKSEYLARCARAWLAWSPEGYGWECFRHYEASLCLSVPVLSPPTVTRYFPLQDRVHAIYYPVEGDGLRDAITDALSNKPALETMAHAARAHTIRHHTHLRVIEHILNSTRIAIEQRHARSALS
jgi:hypothetical protein